MISMNLIGFSFFVNDSRAIKKEKLVRFHSLMYVLTIHMNYSLNMIKIMHLVVLVNIYVCFTTSPYLKCRLVSGYHQCDPVIQTAYEQQCRTITDKGTTARKIEI